MISINQMESKYHEHRNLSTVQNKHKEHNMKLIKFPKQWQCLCQYMILYIKYLIY